MTIWQRLSGFATTVGEAGGTLLAEISAALGLDAGRSDEPQKHIAFTIAVIALSAKMAKADGVVACSEVKAFRRVFQFSPEDARNVERVYSLAQQDTAGYEAYADQIAGVLKDDRKLLEHVLEGLLHVAAADGVLHPAEDTILRQIAERLGFSDSEFRYFRAHFVTDDASPYDVLRLSPDASDAQIKTQYRKLAAENHPDRLMGEGVPPEFVAIATRNMAAINAAYETLSRERGL